MQARPDQIGAVPDLLTRAQRESHIQEAFSFCPAVPPLSTQPRHLGEAEAPGSGVFVWRLLTIHTRRQQFAQAGIPFRMLILPGNQWRSGPGIQLTNDTVWHLSFQSSGLEF